MGLNSNPLRNYSVFLKMYAHTVPEMQWFHVTVNMEWKETTHIIIYFINIL